MSPFKSSKPSDNTFYEAVTQKYLEISLEILLVLDLSCRVTMINNTGCQMLGVSMEEIVGKLWCENFVPESEQEETKHAINQMLTGNIEPYEFHENHIVTSKNEQRLILWHNYLLRNDDDQIIGLLSAGNDITKLKNLEEQKEKFAEQNALMLDILAHDLRNIFIVIQSYLELFCEDRTVERREQNIDYVLKATNAVNQGILLLENVVQLLKEQADRKDKLENMKLLQAIKNAEMLLRDMFLEREIIFNIKGINPDEEILADKLLYLLFLNLFSNSVRYGKNRVIITVSKEKQLDEFVQLTITDNSKGIAPKDREKVFDRFSDVSKKSGGGGTGLGMFIIGSLIKRYGGSISLDNIDGEPYTSGTKITLTLPIKS